jgi:hypothetical protein
LVDGTFGVRFGAFDARVEPAVDGADMARNVLPLAEPLERQVYRLRTDLGMERVETSLWQFRPDLTYLARQ